MKHRHLLLFTLLLLVYSLSAQDGLLDLTFGNNGIVLTDVNESNDFANDLCIQSDGKIIVTGYTSDGIKDFFCLIRYHSDGTLDNDFGINGILLTEFPFTSIGTSIALQLDNKIIVGGHSWGGEANEFALARYLPDGSLDFTFGENGKITTPFPNKNAIGHAIAIQGDGKIILGGHVYTLNNDGDDFAIVRYQTNGLLDASFGENGLITTNFSGFSMDWLNDIKLQSDGKIIAAGFSQDKFAVVRYQIDGSLDTSFGENGLLTTSFLGAEHGVLSAIQIQDNDKILGAGFIRDSFSNFALVRYEMNGELDGSFGINGVVTTTISEQSDAINGLAIQDDNKIIVGGSAFINGQNQFALARYNTNGSLDLTFGEDGITIDYLNQAGARLTAVTLQADGKLLACGYANPFPYDFILTKYTAETVATNEAPSFSVRGSLYPNPAKDFSNFTYLLDKPTTVSIHLLNIDGRIIQIITTNTQGHTGLNTRKIDLSNVTAGVYLIALEVRGEKVFYEIIKY